MRDLGVRLYLVELKTLFIKQIIPSLQLQMLCCILPLV